MKSIGAFLRELRTKKALSDSKKAGAVMGLGERAKHDEVIEKSSRTALVALSAERAGAPPEVLIKLGTEAMEAAAERDNFFETEKVQIAKARGEAERRDREA